MKLHERAIKLYIKIEPVKPNVWCEIKVKKKIGTQSHETYQTYMEMQCVMSWSSAKHPTSAPRDPRFESWFFREDADYWSREL